MGEGFRNSGDFKSSESIISTKFRERIFLERMKTRVSGDGGRWKIGILRLVLEHSAI